MTRIEINPQAIISLGSEITEQSGLYNTEVKTIYDRIDELKRAWTGSASQRFTDQVESFRADYEKLGELLQGFGETLSTVGKNYQNFEDNM